MEPIVSPWFVYFIGVGENIQSALGIIGFFMSFGMLLLFIFNMVENEKAYWRYPIIILVYWVIVTAIPDRKTLIGMAVAQNVTKDRVVYAGKAAVKAHDAIKQDVLDLILAFKDKEEEVKGRK